ncbi:MAG TPA: aspartyl/asparaginyl beta-hydroxylase domain-containing protein [Bryobacteraceae bacterium]|jgi:hypothetical protein
MLKYLRLPFTYDVARMQQEIRTLAEEHWKPHYNVSNYEGGWGALPLYALNGKMDSIYAVHSDGLASTGGKYLPTPLLEHCPYIASILNELEFPKRAVRLLRLESGAIIKEHSDSQLSVEEGDVRLHIPVETNEFVEFYVQDERIIMNEGELWYLNLSLPHRVENRGANDRFHLVIDGVANDWLAQQFARPDVEVRKDAEPVVERYDDETRRLMIQELRTIGTPGALQLVEQLLAEATP